MATTQAIAALEKSYPIMFYGDYESAQSFLDRVVRSRWFRKRHPQVANLGVVLKPLETNVDKLTWAWESVALRRVKFKTALFPVLLMPVWALDELTILHVLAHACTGSGHGRDWARTFLNLTARNLGKQRATILRESFKFSGVRWHRRPVLSEEARARLRERGKRLYEQYREKTDMETGAGGA